MYYSGRYEKCEKCGKETKATYSHGFIDGKYVYSTICYFCLNQTDNYPKKERR